MDVYSVELYSINDIRYCIKSILTFVNEITDICPEKQYDVRIVLNELLANCFLHGNCAGLLPVKVEVTIEDCHTDIFVFSFMQRFSK